jgi:hypothetical protein
MKRAVFFADILGFSNLARASGAAGAIDALSDLYQLLSSDDELAQLLRSDVWQERYALSDSIFLVAEEPAAACKAGAEIFFHLAYLNHAGEAPVLLRGGISFGEALRVGPVFPDFASCNLVGEGVVRAVGLERAKTKGPRLLVDEETATALREDEGTEGWLLGVTREGDYELLWLLPPEPTASNGLLIGEVCETCFRLAGDHAPHPSYGAHYLGYLDLVAAALERLGRRLPSEARVAIARSGLGEHLAKLRAGLVGLPGAANQILDRLDALKA